MTRLSAAVLMGVSVSVVDAEGGYLSEQDDMRGDVLVSLVAANPATISEAREIGSRAAHAARMRNSRRGSRRAALAAADIGARYAEDPTHEQAAARVLLDAALYAAHTGSISSLRRMQ